MKFSVLLPTRNGGAFLENCISSVLEQEYPDLELVISDNANSDQTARIIEKYSANPRVKALRLSSPIGVADNWNRALRGASGEYVLMMGDDDYLLPHYFVKMERILDRYDQPDCVVHNAYSYVAPGSIGDNSGSFYSKAHFTFGPDFSCEGPLSPEQRLGIVRDMFRFVVRIPLNMQTTLVKRTTLLSIPGGGFRPPYPDHYALNSLLLIAKNWVFCPCKLLIVGMSPKSFGHYVYSNQSENGLAYLGVAGTFAGRLPGNELLNGMHRWLNLLKENYPEFLAGVEADRGGYVRRQFYAWVMQFRLGAMTTRTFLRNLGSLSGSDWLRLLASIVDGASWQRLLRVLSARGKQSNAEVQWHGLIPLEGVADIREFAKLLAGGLGK